MSPRELIQQTARHFREAGVPDPLNDAALLLAELTGKSALDLRLDMDTELTEEVLTRYQAWCARREKREPLQYILGTQMFCGRTFQVDGRVLIPRPETELLAELAVTALKTKENPTALDLCCGSGCIAVTMALDCPRATIHATDLSADALAVTAKNAETLHAPLTLHQGNLLQPVDGLRFDLIVSNPPYIPADVCRGLQAEVLQEPMMALDGGEDGLDFYRQIAQDAPLHLNPNGTILLEVGWDQGEAVAALLRDAGFVQVQLHKDYQDIDRMVEGHWPT